MAPMRSRQGLGRASLPTPGWGLGGRMRKQAGRALGLPRAPGCGWQWPYATSVPSCPLPSPEPQGRSPAGGSHGPSCGPPLLQVSWSFFRGSRPVSCCPDLRAVGVRSAVQCRAASPTRFAVAERKSDWISHTWLEVTLLGNRRHRLGVCKPRQSGGVPARLPSSGLS